MSSPQAPPGPLQTARSLDVPEQRVPAGRRCPRSRPFSGAPGPAPRGSPTRGSAVTLRGHLGCLSPSRRSAGAAPLADSLRAGGVVPLPPGLSCRPGVWVGRSPGPGASLGPQRQGGAPLRKHRALCPCVRSARGQAHLWQEIPPPLPTPLKVDPQPTRGGRDHLGSECSASGRSEPPPSSKASPVSTKCLCPRHSDLRPRRHRPGGS